MIRKLVAAAIPLTMLMACHKQPPSQAPDGKAAVSAASASASKSANDGPFGLPLHGKLTDFEITDAKESLPRGFYRLKSVPSPFPGFELYIIEYYDGLGLCVIRAISPTNQSDDKGFAVRNQIKPLVDALTEKYGAPNVYQACAGSSVACDPNYWTMALQNGSRKYKSEWRPKGSPINKIAVVAVAPNIISTFFAIEYQIGDRTACDAARRKAMASNL